MAVPKGAKRKTVIAALMLHPSYAKAAEQLGVCPETISDWLRDQSFMADFQAAGDAALDHAVATIKATASAAIAALAADLTHEKPSVRHSAADKLLTHGAKLLDLHDGREEFKRLKATFDAQHAAREEPAALGDDSRDAGPAQSLSALQPPRAEPPRLP